MNFLQLTSNHSRFFPEGIELLNRTQGRDLFPADYLQKRTEDLDSFVVGVFEASTLISIGIAQVIHEYDFYLPFDPDIVTELSTKRVGSFSTLCVHESYQGKGIGQKVSALRLEWIKSKKCEVVLGVSWVSGKGNTSDRVFEKTGFKKVREVANFFEGMSLQKPFVCPTCGGPPCKCAAIFYRLNLA